MKNSIEVKKLTKRAGNKLLLDEVSFCVPPGSTVGFVGRNGAGKSTTIKCLLGLIHCESEVLQVERQVGWVPERPILFDHLTAEENLEAFGIPRERIQNWLNKIGLGEVQKKQVRFFSKGMQQRLALAIAMSGEPKLLILDEPFSGLDFYGRDELKQILKEIRAQGVTIFFSSHQIEDIKALCDEYVLIHNGKILAQEKLDAHDSLEQKILPMVQL